MAFISRVRLEARFVKPKTYENHVQSCVLSAYSSTKFLFVKFSLIMKSFHAKKTVFLRNISYVGQQESGVPNYTTRTRNQELIIINNIRYVYVLTILRSIHTARHALHSGSN